MQGLKSAVRGCGGPCVYEAVPDGGWGWAVAVAFFFVEVFTYGTIKSLGVFLQDLMTEFGESNSRVSWVIAICVFILTFTAPLATVLSNRFGYRPVVMFGGFLISLGTISSAFVSSINEMYVTIGIVSGLGYCLTFLPTITILSQYFNRRRSLVTALASSGESFAMFAFAPAFMALKEIIGWRRCFIVIGLMQASLIGCGALLRPILIRPDQEVSGEVSNKEKLSVKLQTIYELENEDSQTNVSSEESEESGDSGVTSLSASSADLRATTATQDPSETRALMEDQGEKNQGGQATLGTPLNQLEAGEKEQGEVGPLVQPCRPKLLDFSVLNDGAFICYSLFGLFATLGFFAPSLYIIELSKSRGVHPEKSAYMLSVMAVSEVCGRLSIGVILNKVRMRKTQVLLGCVVLLCLVLLAFALVTEFWGLAACCCLYGFLMGTVGSTHIPMLAEDYVVGIERMPSSVGVYMCIQSFAGLAGPPLAGLLVDKTQNYGSAFYSCAVGMGLGAIFLAMVGPAKSGLCHRGKTRKQEEEEGEEEEGEEERGEEEEEKVSQDSGSTDYLDVDLVVETSPAKWSPEQETNVV
ncbi:monocarboxylate transporter 7-like isoform X1 [Salvelinus namaycush]|uniref:Monocarboxylate transporter 7 n=1 Tax=Salvelinus namaycush TaxID=8040 RepID=A0A8U0QIN1_SALNM|nr:monocarboxylate transporter 7-like isoform X1 [Salvelinus namaycush]